jgi:hypothetical protein
VEDAPDDREEAVPAVHQAGRGFALARHGQERCGASASLTAAADGGVMFVGDIYRKEGLGAVVRELWKREHVDPPPTLRSSEQVWLWINRSDVAFSLVRYLVWDVRLMVLASASLVAPAAELCGGVSLKLLQASELVAYGIESERWKQLCNEAATEWAARMANRMPAKPLTWQEHGSAAVNCVSNAIALMHAGSPPDKAVEALAYGAQNAWRALRDKYQEVDLLPYTAAVRVANEVQLRRLRKVVSPSLFQAPSRYERIAV